MTRPNVLGHVRPLSQFDFRERLSGPIADLCELYGRAEVARVLGCDGETVSNARAEKTTLNAASAFNLLLLDPTALNALAAHYGLTLVPIDGDADEEDQAYGEIADAANEVVGLFVRARMGGAKLCHRSKAGILKAWDRATSVRARLGRRA